MSLGPLLAANLAAISLLLGGVWLLSVRLRDVSIIDAFWGAGFVVVAWNSYLLTVDSNMNGLWGPILVSIWGLRLSLYLAWRKWGEAEDYRYRAMRDAQGERFWLLSLITVFALQGALMWVMSLPIQVAAGSTSNANFPLTVVGFLLALTGIGFESIGDFQLAAFKSDPANAGKLMNRGLWRYTRHPNYFGDFVVWWGFYLVFWRVESWWWTWIGPALMSFLLIRVSGVRLLESSLRSRISGYAEYVRSTSAFLPLPPKRL